MFVVLVLVVCNVRFRYLSCSFQISVSIVLDICQKYHLYMPILLYVKDAGSTKYWRCL